MYQIYVFFDDDNKWSEEFDTYNECQDRLEELVPDFETSVHGYMTIIDPAGTSIMEVRN